MEPSEGGAGMEWRVGGHVLPMSEAVSASLIDEVPLGVVVPSGSAKPVSGLVLLLRCSEVVSSEQ